SHKANRRISPQTKCINIALLATFSILIFCNVIFYFWNRPPHPLFVALQPATSSHHHFVSNVQENSGACLTKPIGYVIGQQHNACSMLCCLIGYPPTWQVD
ncbi:hypothetical protein DPEC_G00348440, partial [Dallia pectoralis]